MPGERTEQATQHRREKARKEGDILHSRELSAAAGTLAGVMVLGAAGQPRSWWPGAAAFAAFLALGAPARWEPADDRADARRDAPPGAARSWRRRPW